MLGVRGREVMGSWVPTDEEQEAKPTGWFYDIQRLAPRDQWYRIGRSLRDLEWATPGLGKVRTLYRRGRDSLARLEK